MPAQAAVVAGRVFPSPDQDYLREMLQENINRSDPRAYRRAMLALGRFDSSKWLGRLQQPVMVVTGSEDTTVSPRLQKILVEKIPAAKHMIIQGGGHAVPVDRAEVFNQLLIEFLNE
jgi:pimeloyl-ACP methyl ester carboxylesterase